MNVKDIIRAWKDEDFRANLNEAERALLPANPAGVVAVSAEDLKGIGGGSTLSTCDTYGCGTSYPPTRLQHACCI